MAACKPKSPRFMCFSKRLITKAILSACMLASASFAHAATVTDYMPTRDTYMRTAADGVSEQLNGTSTSGRASKSFLDFYITDFDRAAINASIAGQLGHALTVDDMPNVKLSLNLFNNATAEGYTPLAQSRPAVFLGTQDWVEGTNTTVGATKHYAIYDPANSANNRTWKNSAGNDVQGFFNNTGAPNGGLDTVQNANFEEWGGEPFTYRQWLLDDNVAFTYLKDQFALGLFLNASDAGSGNNDDKYSNTETWSREANDPSVRPFLQVTVIPEPGSLSIFALGALPLVCRRPRLRRL
jgi:hypothetical protein